MDADRKLLTKTALFLATALLLAVPGRAQQLIVSSTTVALNDNQARSIQVSSSGTTALTYTLSGVPFWLSTFSANNLQTPDTLSFQLSNTNCGTCSATIALTPTGGTPVTVTVTYAPGGTGGGGTLTANPSSLAFSASSGQGATSQNVILSTTSASAINIVGIVSDVSWLSAGVTSGSFSVNSASPATLTVQASAAALANNTYTGHITITPSVGTATTITVTFNVGTGSTTGTIAANPASLTFSAASGQSSTVQTVSLSTASTSPVSILGIVPDVSWLSIAVTSLSVSNISPATLSVQASAASLPNGSYTGHLAINPSTGTQTVITVNFTVGTGGSNGTIFANPGSLTFSALSGQATAAQNVSLTTSASAVSINAINYDVTWLSATVISGSLTITPTSPGTLSVAASAANLPNGSYTGHITITPNSGTATVITVTFNVGTGSGSGGTITVDHNSFNFSYPSNTLAGVVVIASNNASVTSFNVNITSQSSWLLFQGASGGPYTGVQFGTYNITVSQSVAATLASGTYAGTITLINPLNSNDITTINLTLTVTGGTGTGGSLSASPTALTFTASPGGAAQSQNLTVTAPSNASVQFNAQSFNGPFFSVSSPGCNGTPNSNLVCTFTGGQTLTLTVNPGSLSNLGTYSGSLTFQSGSSTVTVYLTLILAAPVTTLTVSPTSLSFTAATGGAAQTQSVTVAVPTNALVQATLSSFNGNFFSVTSTNCNANPTTNPTCSFNGNQTLNVTLNPSSLTSAGTYNGNILLQSGGSSINVQVSLTLTGSGTGGNNSAIAAPASLAFAYQTTSAAFIPQQVITVGPIGTFSATASVSTAQQWLIVSAVGSTGPGYVIVSVAPQGLAVNTYQGTVTITSASGTLSIPVTLTVTASVVVEASPGNVYFQYQAGAAAVQQSITLLASDNSATPVSASTSTSWITVGAPTSTTTPASFTLTMNPSGLCNGLNTGAVTVSAPNAANNGFTIPVVVLVTGSTSTSGCNAGGTGPLTLGVSSLTFSAQVNGALPAAQSLSVVAPTSSTGYTVTSSVQSGGLNWLTVQPSGSLFGTQNLVVSVNQTGLVLGTYTGTISLNTNGTVQTVQVTLVVNTTGSGSTLTVTPASLSFTYSPGNNATTPASQSLIVTSTSGATGVSFTYSVTGNLPFTAVVNNTTIQSGQSLATPATITITPSVAGLAAGATYNGTVTLTPAGAAGVSVPLTLTVSSAPVVSASPTTLTFTYNAGSAAPNAQTVQVSGGSGLTFSATPSSSGNWLSVSPAAGTTPASLSVSVNPAGLTANTYTGNITVTGTGGATGSTVITVTLTVTAPLPSISSLGSAASYLGGSISPGEIITIFGTSIGPTPGVTLALDPATGKVATTLGGVQVLVNGFLAPMVFASNTQVSAVVPYEICASSCGPGTIAQVIVKFLGQSSNGIPTPVAATTTGIFTANASGSGPGAILNANLTVNSPGNPANRGDTVAIYLTGEGLTSPTGVTGKVTTISATGPLTPVPLLAVGVTIDGQPVSISFAGEAPGLVSGAMQLNVQIPANARSGNLPVVVSIGGTSSQPGVTVSVR